jgi:fructan beta-fructosidase
MSLPRELTLKKVGDEWILLQNPVDQLKLLQAKPVPVAAGQELKMQDASYLLEWSWPSSGVAQELSIGDREFVVRYDPASREVSIDRGGSRGFDHPEYRKMSVYKAVVPGTPANLRLRLYMDESIAELYVGDGEVALTSQVFAGQPLVRGSFSNPTPASYIDISPYR